MFGGLAASSRLLLPLVELGAASTLLILQPHRHFDVVIQFITGILGPVDAFSTLHLQIEDLMQSRPGVFEPHFLNLFDDVHAISLINVNLDLTGHPPLGFSLLLNFELLMLVLALQALMVALVHQDLAAGARISIVFDELIENEFRLQKTVLLEFKVDLLGLLVDLSRHRQLRAPSHIDPVALYFAKLRAVWQDLFEVQ